MAIQQRGSMRIIFTTSSRVAIPSTVGPSIFRIDAALADETIDLNIRELVLEPRELNGVIRLVAYDQETDTLFIKEPSDGR